MFKRFGYLAGQLVLVLLLLGLILPKAYADSPSARLYLSPAAANAATGSSLAVEVRLNVSSDSANVVQANLSYPADKIEVTSLSSSSAFFGFPQIPDSYGNGSISFTRGAVPPVSSDQLVLTINFQVGSSEGTAAVTINQASSSVISSNSHSNILSSVGNGSYTITEATSPAPSPSSLNPSTGQTTTPSAKPPIAAPSTNQPSITKDASNTSSAVTRIPSSQDEQSNPPGLGTIMELLAVIAILSGALALRIINRRFRRRRAGSKKARHYSKKGETVAELAARIHHTKAKKHLHRRFSGKQETVAELAARLNRSL